MIHHRGVADFILAWPRIDPDTADNGDDNNDHDVDHQPVRSHAGKRDQPADAVPASRRCPCRQCPGRSSGQTRPPGSEAAAAAASVSAVRRIGRQVPVVGSPVVRRSRPGSVSRISAARDAPEAADGPGLAAADDRFGSRLWPDFSEAPLPGWSAAVTQW